MKSKKIDWLDDYSDLVKVCRLAKFLDDLDIPHANDLGAEADDLHEENFCHDCTSHKDYCECNDGGKYMPEYDDGANYED